MSNALLTIFIITYNHEEAIARCLDSVLEQQTIYPYMIWICEDCSTDSTLKICRNYARQYPEKILLFAQEKNTKGKHCYNSLCKVNTKYFAILEGDDYWCDKEKIQVSIDTLENNPEYVTFAHNTLYNDLLYQTQTTLKDIHQVNITNPVTLECARYLHTSARVHRNIIDFNMIPFDVYDIMLFYLFLDKGPLYYYDKVMSVYNITGRGVWTGLSKREQEQYYEVEMYKINAVLKYRYDSYFTKIIKNVALLNKFKIVFGSKIGWKLYILFRHRKLSLLKLGPIHIRESQINIENGIGKNR